MTTRNEPGCWVGVAQAGDVLAFDGDEPDAYEARLLGRRGLGAELDDEGVWRAVEADAGEP